MKKKKKKKKPLDVSALENDLNELNLEGEEGDDANEDGTAAEEVPGELDVIKFSDVAPCSHSTFSADHSKRGIG